MRSQNGKEQTFRIVPYSALVKVQTALVIAVICHIYMIYSCCINVCIANLCYCILP